MTALAVFACCSCRNHPADWLRWVASEGKTWPEHEPIGRWVVRVPPMGEAVLCICCGLPAQLVETYDIPADVLAT